MVSHSWVTIGKGSYSDSRASMHSRFAVTKAANYKESLKHIFAHRSISCSRYICRLCSSNRLRVEKLTYIPERFRLALANDND